MRDSVNKKWKVWHLKDIDLSGDSDVTNTRATIVLILLLIVLTSVFIYPPDATNSINTAITVTLFITIIAIFYKLIYRNKNFILYDFLYTYLLKINIVTIEDSLNPAIPALEEIEKILTQRNKNCININGNRECPNLQKGITFFWIRKDRQQNQNRDIKYFIPYLGLIMILYALKEKSLKLISTIGFYFVAIGMLYITFVYLFIRMLKGVYGLDNFYTAIASTMLLAIWYIVTIYSALKVVSIEEYINHINREVRRAYSRKFNKIGKGYEQIVKSFEKENAVYIYDYTIDKYQIVNRDFLYQKLKRNPKFITKSVGTVITTIISVIFMLFVETSANVVATDTKTVPTLNYKKRIQDTYNCIKEDGVWNYLKRVW